LLNKGHRSLKTDIDAAIAMYARSIEFDEQNFEAYYWRGVARCRKQDFEAALNDLERSIEINPRRLESYRTIDRILARSAQWERIIRHWDRFLALVPDNAPAYLERAGTHYHNQDFDQALTDLEKACDLGSREACNRLPALRGKLQSAISG
jgi:tetratricopeptide (TPR) repeat protein